MRWLRSSTVLGATLAALAAAGLPGPSEAQIGVRSSTCSDPEAGTLGIRGLRCESCTFSMGRSGITQALFGTEPELIAVDSRGARGEVLRPGDVLVAIDGALITTRRGGQRLESLRMGDEVTMRVRRNGRERELHLIAGSACESTARTMPDLPPEPGVAPLPEAEPRPPTRVGVVRAPEAPPAVEAEPMPMPPSRVTAVEPPTPPRALEPRVSLGFSFECTLCSYRETGIGQGGWTFSEAPVVYRVDRASPAWRGGLRQGDVLLAVDGVRLVTPEGARRFTELAPGQEVVWTVRRDGQIREIATVPGRRSAEAPPEAPAPAVDRLRFSGDVGEAEVEVRGAPVTVTVDEERGLMTITSAELVIYVRVPPGGGGGSPTPRP